MMRCCEEISLKRRATPGLLPANRDQGAKGKINSLAIQSGPSKLLGLFEFVLVDVD